MDQLHQKLVEKKGLYAAWHKHPHYQALQWLVLVMVVVMFAGIFTDRIQHPDRVGLSGLTSEAASPTLPLRLAFTHPDAAAQPTSYGKVIRALYDYGGKLYSGYGDWDTNTGPIKICAFDPGTAQFACEKDAANPADDFLMRNETIARYVTINGVLYVPGIDPGGGGNQEFAYRNASGQWVGANSPFGLVHVFDIATLNNSEIWLFGSANTCCNDDAVAYHSPDGGVTWDPLNSSTNLDLSPTSTSNGFNRLYFGGVYKGKIYTQSSYFATSRVYDPVSKSWAVGPNLFNVGGTVYQGYGSQPMEFAGQLVYCTGYTGVGGRMLAFNGSTVTNALASAHNVNLMISMQVYNGYLYALVNTNKGSAIIRTSDLKNWVTGGNIALKGESASSMRILNNTVYIGTSQSRVYATPLPSFANGK